MLARSSYRGDLLRPLPTRSYAPPPSAAPLASEVKELTTWLIDPKKGPHPSEIRSEIDVWVGSYINAGLKGAAEFAVTLEKTWLTKPKGRPPTQKQAAVRALEMKLANPQRTWKKLACDLLPPGNQANIDSPEQCLRQEVMALRKVLRKYGIPGWEPFNRYTSTRRSLPPALRDKICQE
jgi:hypothetical protein